MKGIVLAGGTGTRLYPLTYSVSKQLLPVYDKPLIYYPLTTLMLAGIRDILVITTPYDQEDFKKLLGDGRQWGISISYAMQYHPAGIAEAFIIAEDFIGGDNVALVLGDNVIYSEGLTDLLLNASRLTHGAKVFASYVNDPERYCVATFNNDNCVTYLEEKPLKPQSNYAILGLYFYDSTVCSKAKQILPSKRGELEITDINKLYLEENNLSVSIMGRGVAWLDAGTHESLLEANNFVATIQKRQGLVIACPEEIAHHNGWINDTELYSLANVLIKTEYGKYLHRILSSNYISTERRETYV